MRSAPRAFLSQPDAMAFNIVKRLGGEAEPPCHMRLNRRGVGTIQIVQEVFGPSPKPLMRDGASGEQAGLRLGNHVRLVGDPILVGFGYLRNRSIDDRHFACPFSGG